MDLVFPVFVRASDSAPSLTPPEPQKSLWQLVIEAGPDDTLQRPTSHAMVTGHYTGREGDGSRGEGESSEAAITAATVPLSTRSSWAPPSYMVKNLMAPGFVERFCAMHGIECSAQVPPPPCLRLEDLQLPPFIVKRLREQLRQDDGRPWASTKAADKPRLEELREVVFGKMQEAHDSAVADNKIAGNAKLDEAQKHEDCEVTLTAIQQLTLTSMLLGHHTVTIAPCKAGKKTASLLATAVLLLSREMCDPKAESPKSHRDETEREHGVEEQMNVRKALHSVSSKAPCAVILVGSYGEVHQCSQWLQNVFTADAFCLVTFRRGSAELVPLPRHVDPSFACTASASAGMPTQSISMTRVSPSLTLDALHECKSQSFFFNDEQSQKTAQSERCGTQHASHRTERKRSREMSPIVCDYGCNGRGRSHSRERERELGREYRRGRSHSRERELGMDRRRGRSHSRERERELGREYRRGRSHSRERELGMDRRRGRSHSRERELGMDRRRGRSHSRERERELGREYRRGRSHSRERELGMDRRRGRSHSRERERELGREYRRGRSHSRERERELGREYRRGRSHSRERELGMDRRRGRSHSRERELGRDRRRGRSHTRERERELGMDRRRGRSHSRERERELGMDRRRGRSHSRERERELGREYRRGRSHSRERELGREYRHGRSHSRERERELGMDRRRGRSHSRERELGREYRRGRSHSRERELGRDRRRGRHRSSSSESRRRRKRSISPIDQNDKWRFRRRYCPASLDKGRDSDYYHDTERHDASYRLPRSRSYERQTESCSRYERRLHRNKSPLSRSASRNGSVGPCAAKSVHVSEMGQLSRLCQPPSAAGAQVHAAGHSNAEVLLGVGAVTEQPTENHEVVPCSLQRSVPVLIATHQAFIEALQSVHGKAEALPIERVRVFCVTDADRVAQPNSQAEVPASWWISLSNSVDVDCQYLISSGRMYEEVNNWLRDTLMRGSPDVVNRYRQRDDTAWFGVQHSVDVVNVEVDTACGQQRKMYEYVEEAKLKRLAEIIMRHFATASGRTSTELMARSVDNVTDSNLTTATTKGIAIMVSSRKEQEVVLSRLLTLLQDRFGFVRCTCSLEDFQRGSADVLITYDWAILVAHESSKASGVKSSRTESSITGPLRFPTMVVNYGFPRVFLEPGKEESLLECLVMRTRALLKGYGTAEGTIRRTNQTGPSPDSGSPMVATKSSVLTLLTERQAYGRLGRLFVQRAQALATP